MRAWKARRNVASLVEKGWSEAPPPIRQMMGFAGQIASRMHGMLATSRSVARIELPRHVQLLSIGAVSWGGDGKTPLACHVARQLSMRGVAVALVVRPVGGRSTTASLVPSGTFRDRGRDVSRWGDEAVMLASRLKDVSVWAGPDRHATILACLACSPSVIVLDDGLSLRGVRKDLEIALLSSGHSCFQPIPAGPLRRPVTDTARADVVGIHVQDEADDLHAEARRLLDIAGASSHPWFAFRLTPVHRKCRGPAFLAAGIARPERFEAAARDAGYEVVGRTWYPDHHVPDETDLTDLAREAGSAGARSVLITEKDAPRFPDAIGSLPVEILEVQLEVVAHGDVLAGSIESALQAGRRG